MRTAAYRSVMLWSVVLSLLVLIASVAGLVDSRPYDQETENWRLQAQGQDLGNLLAVVVLLGAAVRYRAGSERAGRVWRGALLYLIYAFMVYAMAVHLNYLFLVYVAVLALSAWGVIFHVRDVRSATTAYPQGRARTVAAWVLIVTGLMFAGLWLSEIVPALLSDSVPASLTEAGLVVNPIHVIDLAVVLPGFIISGVAALQGRDHGLFWLAPWLVFSVLMGASIVAAMVLLSASGATGALPGMVFVSLIVLASLVAVIGYLRPPSLASSPERVAVPTIS